MDTDRTDKTIDLRKVAPKNPADKAIDDRKVQAEKKDGKDKGKFEHAGVLRDLRDN